MHLIKKRISWVIVFAFFVQIQMPMIVVADECSAYCNGRQFEFEEQTESCIDGCNWTIDNMKCGADDKNIYCKSKEYEFVDDFESCTDGAGYAANNVICDDSTVETPPKAEISNRRERAYEESHVVESFSGEVQLQQGAIVRLELKEALSSQENRKGDIIHFKVVENVVVDGVVVIEAGSEALGQVAAAKAAKGWGKSGKLDIEIQTVDAVDGTKVPLVAEYGEGKSWAAGKTIIGVAAFGILFGGGMKGKKVHIPKGSKVDVFVGEDTFIYVGGPLGQAGVSCFDVCEDHEGDAFKGCMSDCEECLGICQQVKASDFSDCMGKCGFDVGNITPKRKISESSTDPELQNKFQRALEAGESVKK